MADTLVACLIVINVGLKSAILWTDGEVNPSEGKVKQEGRLDWRKLSLVLGVEPMILLIRSFEMILKGFESASGHPPRRRLFHKRK